MDSLLDLLDNMEKNNTTLEEELQNQEVIHSKDIPQENIDIANISTIEPKKWFKFEDFEDVKVRLSTYKKLLKQKTLKYVYKDKIFPCTIAGYVTYPKNENYDVLVIQLGEKYHAIRTDYLIEMQSKKAA